MESSEEQLEQPEHLMNLESPSLWSSEESSLSKINPNHASQSTELPDAQAVVLNLLARIEALEQRLQAMEQSEKHRETSKKKNRRKANEITKAYQCVVEGCEKNYGSQTSLNNHVKLKHSNLKSCLISADNLQLPSNEEC